MIQVNNKHSVQYKNGYFILTWLNKHEKTGELVKAKKQTYPSLEAMILQCGFDMGYEYTDAALKSKADYLAKESASFILAKNKKKSGDD